MVPSLKQMRFWKEIRVLCRLPAICRISNRFLCFQSLEQAPNTIVVRRTLAGQCDGRIQLILHSVNGLAAVLHPKVSPAMPLHLKNM